jgi:hypothetical protein
MTPDEIATLMNETAGQRWGDEAHFQRFAVAFQKRISAASMPAIKLAMEAERENGARAEREACAELVEGMDVQHPKYIAAAIRARGNA